MDYLDEDDVLAIRRRLAKTDMAGKDFGYTEPTNLNNFSSAVARQQAGFGNRLKYTSPCEVAATLFYGLALNHAFENGNKRTALVTMLTFLQRNKVVIIDTTEDELYDFATQVAGHTFPIAKLRTADHEVEAIADWLTVRTRSLELGDRKMQYKELKAQLEGLGCWFAKPNRSYVKIHRQVDGAHLTSKIVYQRADFEVPVQFVKRVRKQLRLDELSGTDSAAFYDLESSVDAFVNRYRNLLDRLAET